MAAKNLSVSKIFLWILMGLLFVGLAGFGATNLSGTLRSIGSVGDKEIRVERYVSALRQEMRAFEAQIGEPLTFQRAQEFGLPDRVMAQLVTSRALDDEAARLGLSVGDEELVAQLQAIQSFQGPDGAFNREAYRFALQNAGLSEAMFEADLRDETARSLLQGAVLAGNRMPEIYINTLLDYALETRDLSWAVLDDSDVTTGVPVPSDDDLQSYYDANIADYTRPETKDITYAWLTPDMILDTVEVDEDLLRQAYDERSALFNLPERRLVERLIFPDAEAAQSALDRITEGLATFEDEVAARGLDLSDVDLGDVTRDDLGAATDPVFEADTGAVVGPSQTSLGPALFRVNAVLPAQTTPFEEARELLRGDLALDRARRVIEGLAEDSEDQLAGGATLEELAQQSDFDLGQINWALGDDSDIAGYPAFRDVAQALTEDDFPTVMELGDGGLFAVRLNGITPPTPRPLDSVLDAVEAAWTTEQITAQLSQTAQTLVDRLNAGEGFETLGLTDVQTSPGLTRGDRVTGMPASALEAAFTLEPGQALLETGRGQVIVLRVDAITAADRDSDDAQSIAQALENQAASDLAQDIFGALAVDIQRRAGVQINEQARTAVHTNLQ